MHESVGEANVLLGDLPEGMLQTRTVDAAFLSAFISTDSELGILDGRKARQIASKNWPLVLLTEMRALDTAC